MLTGDRRGMDNYHGHLYGQTSSKQWTPVMSSFVVVAKKHAEVSASVTGLVSNVLPSVIVREIVSPMMSLMTSDGLAAAVKFLLSCIN